MVKKGLYLSIIVVLLLGVGSLASCRRHSPQHKAEFILDYVSETLDLTASQQAHLEQIKDELMQQGRQMHADRAAMYDEFIDQLRSEEIDQARLKAMVADRRTKMDELIDLGIVRLVEFHKTLTPAQREKLVAKLESFKKWHEPDWQ